MTNLPEEIIDLVSKNGKIETAKIPVMFDLSNETADEIIDFLVEFGFLCFDRNGKYLKLSKPLQNYFKKTSD